MKTDRHLCEVLEHMGEMLRGDLASQMLLPEGIPHFRVDEVGGYQRHVRGQEAQSTLSVNLRNKPLDCNAGVDDYLLHRSRSSRISSALSLYCLPARRSCQPSATDRASSMDIRIAASSRMSFASPCRERLCRFALCFRRSTI